MQGVPDGKNRALYQRARELSDYFDLTLITALSSEVLPEIAKRARLVRISVPKPFQKGILFKIYYTFYILFRLLPRAELVLYTFHRNGFTAAGCLKLLKRRSVTWFADMQHTPYYYWDYAAHLHLTTIKKIYYRAIGILYIVAGKILLPKADRVFVMSYNYGEGFGLIMEKDFKVSCSRLSPIPNGVDVSLVRKFMSEKRELSLLGDNSHVRCIYAGNVRLERLKYLLKIVALLKEEGIKPILFLCGTIDLQAERFLKDAGVNEVQYLGFIPHSDLLNLYTTVDVSFVLIDPLMRDHQYCHPGKLFEAMAMGKLVVVSNLRSISKVVVDGENGLILNHDNLPQGVRQLCAVLRNPKKRIKIERNAQDSVNSLDWKILNERWLANIKETMVVQ
jgi:glycosyltransferase involved in cell wall biosynthesis